MSPSSLLPASIPDSQLGLDPDEIRILRQHQQIALANGAAAGGSVVNGGNLVGASFIFFIYGGCGGPFFSSMKIFLRWVPWTSPSFLFFRLGGCIHLLPSPPLFFLFSCLISSTLFTTFQTPRKPCETRSSYPVNAYRFMVFPR